MIRQCDPPKVVKRVLVLLWLFYTVVFVINVTLYRDPLRSPLAVGLVAVTGYAVALVVWSQANFSAATHGRTSRPIESGSSDYLWRQRLYG